MISLSLFWALMEYKKKKIIPVVFGKLVFSSRWCTQLMRRTSLSPPSPHPSCSRKTTTVWNSPHEEEVKEEEHCQQG